MYQIRSARIKDIPQIVVINRDSWLETYPNAEAKITTDDVAHRFNDLAKLEQRWTESFEKQGENAVCFVYEMDDNILGYCVLKKTPEGGYLNAIYVIPGSTNQGVGTKLMNQALNWFKSENRVYLTVANYNHRAIGFYQKFGFKISHKIPEPFKIIDGVFIPLVEMEKFKTDL
jgi:ribosomal protein S18 acetylase RimI-like enzyme